MLKDSKGLNENIEKKRANIKNQFLMGIERREREEKSPFRRLKKNIIKVAAGIAIVCGVTAVGCYVSPAFADMVKDIPGLNLLYSLTSGEKSLKVAFEHGYLENLDSEQKDGDYTFKISYAMRDNQMLTLHYQIYKDGEAFDNYDIFFDDLLIKDSKGNVWGTGGKRSPAKKGYGYGVFKIRSEELILRKDLSKSKVDKLINFNECKGEMFISADVFQVIKNKEENIFSIENHIIDMDRLEKSEGKEIHLSKEIIMGEDKFILYKAKVEPSCTGLYFEVYPKDEEEFLNRAKEYSVQLEDDKGNVYSMGGDTGYRSGLSLYGEDIRNGTEERKLVYRVFFNSAYFYNPEFLKLKRFELYDGVQGKAKIDISKEKVVYSDYDLIHIDRINMNCDKDRIIISLKDNKKKWSIFPFAKVIIGDKEVECKARLCYSEEEIFIRIELENEGIDKEDVKTLELKYYKYYLKPENIFDEEIIIPMSDKKYLREEVKEGN